jgi:hypothetical protein
MEPKPSVSGGALRLFRAGVKMLINRPHKDYFLDDDDAFDALANWIEQKFEYFPPKDVRVILEELRGLRRIEDANSLPEAEARRENQGVEREHVADSEAEPDSAFRQCGNATEDVPDILSDSRLSQGEQMPDCDSQ